MKRFLFRSAMILASAAAAPAAQASNYYFSSSASGIGNGSTANPYSSLSSFDGLDLNPGDNVYLSGTFSAPSGGLTLGSQDAGTAAQPVNITSWGAGPATINAGNSFGIKATNVGGIDISNLHLIGSGPTSTDSTGLYTNTQDGVGFYATQGIKQNNVSINNVSVAGFGQNGINFQGTTGQSGFNNISITNALLEKNQVAGLSVSGDYNNANRNANTNVYVGHVTAQDNYGRANRPNEGNSGNGIVLGQTNGAVIERSVATGNGTADASTQGGSVGIWAWDSNNVTIQYNESYRNGTAGTKDGGGFDLDGGVTNSVMQYNYSHDNDGAGYLLAEFNGARPSSGNVVRYNVSQNDGRKNGYAGIHAFGPITSADVYNNTVYISPSQANQAGATNEAPAAVKFRDGSTKNIRLFNNVFIVSTDGASSGTISPRMVVTGGASGFTFLDNDYWNTDGSQAGNLADADAQNLNPMLLAAGQGPTLGSGDDLEDLQEYALRDGSPLTDKGLNLFAVYGIDMGTGDFFGQPITGLPDIGAAESALSSAQAPEPTGLALLGAGLLALRRRRHAKK